MTDKDTAPQLGASDGRITIKLLRDKEGQFFDLPKGWKFTNSQATIHAEEGAIVLRPMRPGKLKLPLAARQPSDYPKKSIKK